MGLPNEQHRFLDEAGDTTFYLKGKRPALGTEGVSNAFIIGMVKISDSLQETRDKIQDLQNEIISDPYLNEIPSIVKKMNKSGYFLHAKDDPDEVRMLFYKLISTINCSFEAVLLRKDIDRYAKKHLGKETEFYADALSFLIKNKLTKSDKLILNISERGNCTKNTNLMHSLDIARQRQTDSKNNKEIITKVHFNVEVPTNDTLLSLADYFCWAVQRVFEKGQVRYYNFLKDKISTVMDIYDKDKAGVKNGWKNYYSPKNPLTPENKICLK